MSCVECKLLPPHYGAKYVFSCIGCYARWICDAYTTPQERLKAIQANGRFSEDELKQAVKIEFEKRKRK